VGLGTGYLNALGETSYEVSAWGSVKGETKKKGKSSPAGSGVRHNTAVEHLKEKYSVCKRQAELYVAAVFKNWRVKTAENHRNLRNRAIRNTQEVGCRALKEKRYPAALKAIELQMRLEGIHPDQEMRFKQREEAVYQDESCQRLGRIVDEVRKER
jgi:hypothetical protein